MSGLASLVILACAVATVTGYAGKHPRARFRRSSGAALYPWVVELRDRATTNSQAFCRGTLVHHNSLDDSSSQRDAWVLTASHCVADSTGGLIYQLIYVRLANNLVLSSTASDIVINPMWMLRGADHLQDDLALIYIQHDTSMMFGGIFPVQFQGSKILETADCFMANIDSAGNSHYVPVAMKDEACPAEVEVCPSTVRGSADEYCEDFSDGEPLICYGSKTSNTLSLAGVKVGRYSEHGRATPRCAVVFNSVASSLAWIFQVRECRGHGNDKVPTYGSMQGGLAPR